MKKRNLAGIIIGLSLVSFNYSLAYFSNELLLENNTISIGNFKVLESDSLENFENEILKDSDEDIKEKDFKDSDEENGKSEILEDNITLEDTESNESELKSDESCKVENDDIIEK